ncbi:unnamed protein product [Pseudo-nitzschia multistriata]|uniref:Uncharacterized protein n=1 Tax=Pseudo-nitzschia multistriata TaxID=183589 RepID=A0A448YWG2_9STRA|nr:unnamed protein product [Pseudo-nitzschia multistriata]
MRNSSSSLSQLSKTAIVLVPVVVAFFLSTVPKQLGFYRWLSESISPQLVGCSPATILSEDQWGFTFGDLYGDEADNDGDAAAYRNRLEGQTALVTGANSGTGYEVSLALARLGVGVTMACRNPEKCASAAEKIGADEVVARRIARGRGDLPTTEIVDVSSLESVKAFCDRFLAARLAPLDMLFLNAGIGDIGPSVDGSLRLSADGIELIFATNVVGHHLLYRLLEPLLLVGSSGESEVPARIVLTSSCTAYDSLYPYRVATDLETLNGVSGKSPFRYPQSKLAQFLWARELTERLSNSGGGGRRSVYANAAHPGFVATDIWDKNPFDFPLGGCLKSLLLSAKSVMWTPEEGALTLLYLGTAVDKLREDDIRGQYFHPQSRWMKDNYPLAGETEAYKKDLQKRLWSFLEELVAEHVA